MGLNYTLMPQQTTVKMTHKRWNAAHSNRKATTILFQLLILINFLVFDGVNAKLNLCDVETGQTNIILDIEESRGDVIGQQTTPPELPIFGDPETEISLELVFQKTEPIFLLSGKTLQLLKPLDRDKDNLSHIVFQISCTIQSTRRNRNIPIIVRVSDVNDNPPLFVNTPYETTVPESTPIGTTIFRNILAQDKDAGVNGLVEYFLIDSSKNLLHSNDTVNVADGNGVFAISYPHQGQVTVAKALDYERIQRYYLTIVASDRARNSSERLSATTVLTVNIADSDDLDPSFIYRGCVNLDGACINPEYTATVPSGTLQGVLNIHPERIQAIDLDQISAPIKYSFVSGAPSTYNEYFEIDEQTGIVRQKKLVDSSVTARQFDITIQAEEVSEAKRSTTARLTINVKPVDSFPPVINASSNEGFVDENSPKGTKVLDLNGKPIKLITTDADIPEDGEQPSYTYELTTPSFVISSDGILLVNDPNLDRDSPNLSKLRFQVVAREVKGNAASSPMSITVNLNDINDNTPKLALIPPVQITAGNERRLIAKANATDNDSGENAVITYTIHHVSNNGMKKFGIDKSTGEIEAIARVVAGERYSITVQASDIGNLYSQAIVEVTIIPGPNTKPPKFIKNVYDVQVSEGADINSTVAVVKAEDPESDPVHYTIVSGNDLRQFSIGTESGVISVIRKLDREQITRYQLIVRADDNGGLSSSATINIRVTDINDNNPIFDESMMPFKFDVEEGKANQSVGVVHAHDIDEGVNAEISYSLSDDIPFTIDKKTGEIRTKVELDYEKIKDYKFVVTAKDSAPDSRLGTASVTVNIKDVPDEVPKFTEALIEVKIPENAPDMTIATVVAKDPDTKPEITYVLKNGPSEHFKIDPKTGVIRTVKGLDYEEEKMIEIIVGTAENPGRGAGDIVKIKVNVEDRNDNPPVFISIPESVTINDDLPIGSKVGAMPAVDGDGTSPSNSIRYEIVGRGKAQKYFQVDSDTGDILLRDELKKEEDTEYQVDVRAFDLGEPQLSSVSSLPIYVKHVLSDPILEFTEPRTDTSPIMNPESVGLAFSDDVYTISVPETTGINSTLKLLQIINSKKATKNRGGFKCEITNGNEWNLFKTNIEDHSCGLVLINSLDYENKTSHEIGIKLTSTKYLVNPQKSFCHVKIIVQDQNDNAPVFKFPSTNRNARNDTFYGIVSVDTDIDTPIMTIKANDADSGVYGSLKYQIYDEDEFNYISKDETPSSYFTIAEDTGILKTQKALNSRRHSQPFKFIVEVRDNNGNETMQGVSVNLAKARIVINTISDANRMALVFADSSPKEVRRHARALEDLLYDKSPNLLIEIEKFSNRRTQLANGSIVELSDATDVWFYAIDPQTENILERNNTEIFSNLMEPSAQSQINLEASGIVHATAQGITAPIEVPHVHQQIPIKRLTAGLFLDEEIFPYVLIFISAVILILGTSGIIYICISWSRYKNFKQQMRNYTAPTNPPPRYDPVILNSPPSEVSLTNLKEYETQMLGMAVNEEQEEMQIEYRSKHHTFGLDNMSYIKDQGQSSPTNSDTPTVVIGTLQRNNRINLLNNINQKQQNSLNKTIEMNRNNYANPLSIDTNFKAGTTLTLGRIKSERNQIINGYDDTTLNRNNLSLAPNNTFSTLGRPNRSQHNNLANNNHHSTLNRNHRYHADLPITNPIFKRHQSSEMLNCESNDNVYFGGNGNKRAIDHYAHLGYPYNIDRSEQETTTEL
ncbi:unnamed protein product [Chironomus riparius]|uniref:Cadherin domain-containing protein n=1 Tax=Chironomus riparius TaxID=315576 RepID=A0A9P0J6Y2_9DIPT|nr:unnamed protein product [Chironomus riparius]